MLTIKREEKALFLVDGLDPAHGALVLLEERLPLGLESVVSGIIETWGC